MLRPGPKVFSFQSKISSRSRPSTSSYYGLTSTFPAHPTFPGHLIHPPACAAGGEAIMDQPFSSNVLLYLYKQIQLWQLYSTKLRVTCLSSTKYVSDIDPIDCIQQY